MGLLTSHSSIRYDSRMSSAGQSQELTNIKLVVLALWVLGGDAGPVGTEDVAMKAHELAPGRFSWRKYPEQVSLEHVRVYLSDAKKPKYGTLVGGDGTRGWHLTSSGTRWAAARGATITSGMAGRDRVDRDAEERRRLERIRLAGLPAHTKYLQGSTVHIREAEAVFRINEYVNPARKKLLVDRMCSLFDLDEQLGQFVEDMAQVVFQR